MLFTRGLQSFTGLLFALIAVRNTFPAAVATLLAAAVAVAVVLIRRDSSALLRGLRDPSLLASATFGAVGVLALSVASVTANLATVSFLAQLTPVFLIAFAPLYREVVTRRDLVAMLVGLVGGAFLVTPQPGNEMIGVVLALAAAAVSALANLNGRKNAEAAWDPSVFAAVMLVVGGFELALFSFVTGAPPQFAPLQWLLIAGVAAIFVITNVTWLIGLRTVRAMQSVMLRPFSASLTGFLGVVFLGQPLGLALVAGSVLVVVSTVLAARQPPSPVAPDPTQSPNPSLEQR